MNWVTTSIKLYATLVRLYPQRFREAFGDELQLVFRDCARDGFQRAGAWGVLHVWLGVLPDLVNSAAEQHAGEDFPVLLKILTGMLSGAGLIGGALWILAGFLILQRPPGTSDGVNRDIADLMPLFFIGVQMVSMGLIAVFLLPSRQWSMPTRVLVLIAAAGGLVTAGIWQVYADSANWMILISGSLVQTACVALAGVGLLRQTRSRTWGGVLLMLGLTLFFTNTEDWRAIFLALSGALTMGLMVLMFRSAPGPNPGAPALS